MTTVPDLVILRFLARRDHATASAIGAACAMAPGEVRARLVMLESQHFIAGRQDKDTSPPRRVYFVTAEGRRAAGISGARSTA